MQRRVATVGALFAVHTAHGLQFNNRADPEKPEKKEKEQATYNCQNEQESCCIDGTQDCAEEYKKPKTWGASLENPERLSKYMDDIEFVGELFYSIGCARQIDTAQNMEAGIKKAKKMKAAGASEEEIAKEIAERQGADESYLKEKGAMMWVDECKKLNAKHLERCPREMCAYPRKVDDFDQCKKECELKYADLDGHCSKQGVELQEILGGRAKGSAKKTECIEEHCPKIGGQILSAAAQKATKEDLAAAKKKLCDEQKAKVDADAELSPEDKENTKKIIDSDCSICDEGLLNVCVNDATAKTTETTLFDFCRSVYNTWQEYEELDASGQIQR